MKAKHFLKRALGLIMAAFTLAAAGGCMRRAYAEDLMRGVSAERAEGTVPTEAVSQSMTAFAVKLLQNTVRQGNALLSPLCTASALAMTANGARGETLAQTERALGLTTDELNGFFAYTLARLNAGRELALANSLWIKSNGGFEPNADFLQANARFYRADVYSVPFDDTTADEINRWVKKSTRGTVPEMIDEIDPDAVLYLVSALAFDAAWETRYTRDDLWDGEFTTEAGEKREVKFMSSDENAYLDDGKATGFMKPYKGGRYAFAAMLPNEGVSLEEYVSGLDGAALYSLLSNPAQTKVTVNIPEFTAEFGADLSPALQSMGLTQAFDDGAADFSGMGASDDGNIFIKQVVHRTFIEVNEHGTKAGAATIFLMPSSTAAINPCVTLDRPFLYMLVDLETGIPFFIGTMADPA